MTLFNHRAPEYVQKRGDERDQTNTLRIMILLVAAVRVSALTAVQPSAASDVGHATFYGTCAGLIIAVLVVLYFSEKIIPPDQHGPWAIYLGAIIGALLLTPLLALAGFMPDTFGTRVGVAGGTLLFLLGAGRVVVTNWGREDGRRRAATRQPHPFPAWDASTVLPSPEHTASTLTERERAAQVFAATAHLIRQFNPDIVVKQIDSGQLNREAERQVRIADQWMRVEPQLLAVSAGYPSNAVRRQILVFHMAAVAVMKASSDLVAAARKDLDDDERDELTEEARDLLLAFAAEWDQLVAALHAHPRDAVPGLAKHGHRNGYPRVPRSRRTASRRGPRTT
jgi:hypothetical protein